MRKEGETMIRSKCIHIMIACMIALAVLGGTLSIMFLENIDAHTNMATSSVYQGKLFSKDVRQISSKTDNDISAKMAKKATTENREVIEHAMKVISGNETLTNTQKTELESLGFTDEEIARVMEQKNNFIKNNKKTTVSSSSQKDADSINGWQKKEDTKTADISVYIILFSSVFVSLLGIALAFFFRRKR